jgi:hypothetical protein
VEGLDVGEGERGKVEGAQTMGEVAGDEGRPSWTADETLLEEPLPKRCDQ